MATQWKSIHIKKERDFTWLYLNDSSECQYAENERKEQERIRMHDRNWPVFVFPGCLLSFRLSPHSRCVRCPSATGRSHPSSCAHLFWCSVDKSYLFPTAVFVLVVVIKYVLMLTSILVSTCYCNLTYSTRSRPRVLCFGWTGRDIGTGQLSMGLCFIT